MIERKIGARNQQQKGYWRKRGNCDWGNAWRNM